MIEDEPCTIRDGHAAPQQMRSASFKVEPEARTMHRCLMDC
jgi:hypothetical protein